MWHIVGGINILSEFQLPSTCGLGFMMFKYWRYDKRINSEFSAVKNKFFHKAWMGEGGWGQALVVKTNVIINCTLFLDTVWQIKKITLDIYFF